MKAFAKLTDTFTKSLTALDNLLDALPEVVTGIGMFGKGFRMGIEMASNLILVEFLANKAITEAEVVVAYILSTGDIDTYATLMPVVAITSKLANKEAVSDDELTFLTSVKDTYKSYVIPAMQWKAKL